LMMLKWNFGMIRTLHAKKRNASIDVPCHTDAGAASTGRGVTGGENPRIDGGISEADDRATVRGRWITSRYLVSKRTVFGRNR
jgi:hypothetical protein